MQCAIIYNERGSFIQIEIRICAIMKWKILTFVCLIFSVDFVISSECNNTHLDNLIGNTARNVSGWNIYINYGQFEGNNLYIFCKINMYYIYNFKVIIPIMTFGNQNVAMDKFGMAHVDGEKIVAMAMEKILDLLRHSLVV